MIIHSHETLDVPVPRPDGLASGAMRLHLFRPVAEGRFPGVLFYSEIYQVTAPIRRLAALVAGHGYVVAVPEVYHEHEPPGTVLAYDAAGTERGNALKFSKPVAAHDADAAAALTALAAHPACDRRPRHAGRLPRRPPRAARRARPEGAGRRLLLPDRRPFRHAGQGLAPGERRRRHAGAARRPQGARPCSSSAARTPTSPSPAASFCARGWRRWGRPTNGTRSTPPTPSCATRVHGMMPNCSKRGSGVDAGAVPAGVVTTQASFRVRAGANPEPGRTDPFQQRLRIVGLRVRLRRWRPGAITAAGFLFNAAITAIVVVHMFGPGRITSHRIQGAILVTLNVAALFSIRLRLRHQLRPRRDRALRRRRPPRRDRREDRRADHHQPDHDHHHRLRRPRPRPHARPQPRQPGKRVRPPVPRHACWRGKWR